MMVLESTKHVRALIPENKEFISSIYTREKKLPNSIYTCKICNNIYKMGNGEDFKTIEELKRYGCKVCGGKSFSRNLNIVREKAADNKSLGKHILAEFYGCDFEELNNQDNIQVHMRNAAIKAKATIVNESFHKFSPWGVSGVIVIQESHLTIHTWPEYCYAAVDLFTCGKDIDSWNAFEYLKENLKCSNVEFSSLLRGDLDSVKRFI